MKAKAPLCLIVMLAVCAAISSRKAAADPCGTVNSTSVASGGWGDAANWNPAVVPDNIGCTTYNVGVNNSLAIQFAYNAPFDYSGITVDSVSVSGVASLELTPGFTSLTAGQLNNAGKLVNNDGQVNLGRLTNGLGAYLWTGGFDSRIFATSVNNYGEIVTSDINGGGVGALSSFNNGPTGTIIDGGGIYAFPSGTFTNAGTVELVAQTTVCCDAGLFYGGTYIQTAGTTIDDDYMSTTALDLEGGVFTFGSSGLVHTGSLTLGPESVLGTTGTYSPGSMLTVAEYTSLAGTFGSIEGAPFPGGRWKAAYGADSLTLTAVPEPSGLLLVALALLAAAVCRFCRGSRTASACER